MFSLKTIVFIIVSRNKKKIYLKENVEFCASTVCADFVNKTQVYKI